MHVIQVLLASCGALQILALFLALQARPAKALALPSWGSLGAMVPSSGAPAPEVVDCALQGYVASPPPVMSGVVLYRERNGWCPYSERVWLALEAKGVPHSAVLIDNTGGGRPRWFGGTTPRLRFEDGLELGESMDIVRAIDERFPASGPGLYAAPDTQALVGAFRDVFPRGARPSSRAAFVSGPRTDLRRVLRDHRQRRLHLTRPPPLSPL